MADGHDASPKVSVDTSASAVTINADGKGAKGASGKQHTFNGVVLPDNSLRGDSSKDVVGEMKNFAHEKDFDERAMRDMFSIHGEQVEHP
jgi:hypothetical protein